MKPWLARCSHWNEFWKRIPPEPCEKMARGKGAPGARGTSRTATRGTVALSARNPSPREGRFRRGLEPRPVPIRPPGTRPRSEAFAPGSHRRIRPGSLPPGRGPEGWGRRPARRSSLRLHTRKGGEKEPGRRPGPDCESEIERSSNTLPMLARGCKHHSLGLLQTIGEG